MDEAADFQDRFADRFPLLLREQSRQLLLLLKNEPARREQDGPPFGRRHLSPLFQRPRGDIDRPADVMNGSLGYGVDDLCGGRVSDLDRLLALRVPLFTGDEELSNRTPPCCARTLKTIIFIAGCQERVAQGLASRAESNRFARDLTRSPKAIVQWLIRHSSSGAFGSLRHAPRSWSE